MKRNIDELAERTFDVVVIGGGVYGLCTAWDAALRGLSVAVLEKDDFGHACSSANYKLIHGGLRYLQHLNFRRMRTSILERRTMLRIAPHLVEPVGFVIPCSGHGIRGPEAMRLALWINDLIGWDRNRGLAAGRRIPAGTLWSAEETMRQVPGLAGPGLNAGALYYDAQVYSVERLTLSFALAAEEAGAVAANYAEVTRLHHDGRRVTHASARDTLDGRTFSVRGHVFVNMTGPWSEITRQLLHTDRPDRAVVRSKGVQLLVPRLSDWGFAVETRQKDKSALIRRGGRSLFVQPWRGASFIGQSDTIYRGTPDDFRITRRDVADFLDLFNRACPSWALSESDVLHAVGGMIPVGDDDPNPDAANVSHRYEILDHEREDGLVNMISAIGVKFTISRYIAERAVDLAVRKLGARAAPCATALTPLPGGRIDDVAAEIERAQAAGPFPPAAMAHLIRLYGTQWRAIADRARAEPGLNRMIDGSGEVSAAEIAHIARTESPAHLDDILIRRTDLGTLGDPGERARRDAAAVAGAELGWSPERREEETRRARDATRLPAE
jgi:glycerol-3-phosphate dehydrogenase